MAIIGLDLGGTKLAVGIFDQAGKLFRHHQVSLDGRTGPAVGALLCRQIRQVIKSFTAESIEAIGIAIPGIYNPVTERVWAPNIGGWEDYPLKRDIEKVSGGLAVMIDSDRVCCILGETWIGNARGCSDAVFLTVGTGIAAGVMSDGNVIRGAGHIAGALGWMAIERKYESGFKQYGCLETYGCGDGMARLAEKIAAEKNQPKPDWSASDIIRMADQHPIAKEVIEYCICSWGIAVANLISIFNPQKIIFGGGVFGPAISYLPRIHAEANKWAQPISQQQVEILPSSLYSHAALYGAARLNQHFLHAQTNRREV